MAIKLDFCNIIVQVAKIKEKLGDQVFKDRFSVNTDVNWNDGLPWHDGCMDHFVLSDILDGWEASGLELIGEIDGQKHWKDLCLVDSGHGPSYPCDWIEYDAKKNIVWLKGTDPGEAAGPEGHDINWDPEEDSS